VRAPALLFAPKPRFSAGNALVFCDVPLPLRRAYFLGDGSALTPRFERMTAADALIEWLKNSFLLDIEEKRGLASHFDRVAKLANRTSHYRLDYPRRFDELGSVRQAIVEHSQHED